MFINSLIVHFITVFVAVTSTHYSQTSYKLT